MSSEVRKIVKSSNAKLTRARLGKGSVIWSALESERFHQGLKISVLDTLVVFKKTPQLDPAGKLLTNSVVFANVKLQFGDGAQVRFSNYPLVVKAGSPIQRQISAHDTTQVAA